MADGFHRWQAARDGALLEIAADIRQGTKRDAILYSVGANATHGLKRTNADKRRAVLTLLNDEEWKQWSNAEVGRRCGVSLDLVNRTRHEISPNVSLSESRTYTNKHGQKATMKVGNIGKKDETATQGLTLPRFFLTCKLKLLISFV